MKENWSKQNQITKMKLNQAPSHASDKWGRMPLRSESQDVQLDWNDALNYQNNFPNYAKYQAKLNKPER